MELLKNGAGPAALKVDGDIVFSAVGNNLTMDVAAYVLDPQGRKQYVGHARFEFIDPQILRSLVKFATEGRERKYGRIITTP